MAGKMEPDVSPNPTRRWIQHSAERTVVWPDCLIPNGLSAFLNFQGEARLSWESGDRVLLRPGTLTWLRAPAEGCTAIRLAGPPRHECLSVHFPDAWLAETLREARHGIQAEFRSLVLAPFADRSMLTASLTPADKVWAQSFMAPHLCEPARRLLDTTRITEFLLRRIFESSRSDAPVLNRTERLARERVERVKAAVLLRLDEPPSLEELAAIAGCNHHYLSRTFTKVEGRTFSLWLRGARIRKAATLLASGECNVSEAAVEVGYRSLSHFSRAFFEEKGVQPSRWVEYLSKDA